MRRLSRTYLRYIIQENKRGGLMMDAKKGYPQKLVESSKAQREYNPCFVVETFLLFLVHSVVEKYVFE